MGRMSSIALSAVILGEGKSLISKPGQMSSSVMADNPSRGKLHEQLNGWMILFSFG